MAGGTSSATPTHPLTPSIQADIERWFIRRGVPQLVEGYSSEARMDARAAPLIAGWLAIGTILFWGTRPDWPWWLNVAGVIGTLTFVVVGYATVAWMRGRRPVIGAATLDLLEVFLLGLLPAVPAGLIDESLRGTIVAGLNSLLGIGVIYVVVGFGLLELAAWATGRLGDQLASMVTLVARTLPLLLILVVFLLFAAEIWEMAHAMSGAELAAVLVLLLVIAALLCSTTFGRELRRIESSDDWETTLAYAGATPAGPLTSRIQAPEEPTPRLTWLQRTNVSALVLVDQLLQSTFVAVVVMAFLVVFGLLALPASVLTGWVGEPLVPLSRFELLGETRVLSVELLTVAALLGGIVGLYYTGLALTDASHRSEHFDPVVLDVRRLLAVRAVYLEALRMRGNGERPAPEEGLEPSVS